MDKRGIEIIAIERERQINGKGFSLEHDQEHDDSSLLYAALAYASPEIIYIRRDYVDQINFITCESVVTHWRLRLPRNGNKLLDNTNNSTRDQRIKHLAKAGALIAAEIDRLLNKKLIVK